MTSHEGAFFVYTSCYFTIFGKFWQAMALIDTHQASAVIQKQGDTDLRNRAILQSGVIRPSDTSHPTSPGTMMKKRHAYMLMRIPDTKKKKQILLITDISFLKIEGVV